MSIEGPKRSVVHDPAIAPDLPDVARTAAPEPVEAEAAVDAGVPLIEDDVWSGVQADLRATGLESALRSGRAGASSMPKDFIPLEEWYQGMPACTRLMDQVIGLAARALDDAVAAGTCGGLPGLEGEPGAGELLAVLEQLAAELRAASPNLDRLAELAGQADRHLLDLAAGGDAAARGIMQAMYGSSAAGGGAFGSSLARRLGEPFARGAALPASAAGRAGEAAQAAGGAAQSGAARAPEGYDALDGARGGQYLRRGSSGPEVEALQRALNAAGVAPPLAVDGKLGPATEAAIKKFQQEHGCAVDGVVGPETMGALDRALGLPPRSGAPSPANPPPGGFPTPGGPPTPRSGRPEGPSGPSPVGPAPSPVAGSVLDAARSQIGVREATGNNDGVPAERYSNGQQEPWCANFVSWCFRQAGHPLPGNQEAIGSCDTMAAELRARGALFQSGERTPQPGDVIFFGQPGDYTHVGIVERVEGGKVYTVEGNSGDRVTERSYDLGDPKIQAYGRW